MNENKEGLVSEDAIGAAGTVMPNDTVVGGSSANFDSASGESMETTTIQLPKRKFLTYSTPTDEVREYFSRPTYGGTVNWGTTAMTMTTVDPCTAYFAKADVLARLRGHHHFRGTMVVTVTTVTSPHHIGRVAVTLAPLAPTQQAATMLNSVSIFPADNTLVIDASTANSITLKLPFSHAVDWLNFYNEKRLGLLYFNWLCPIKRDDGGTVGPPKLTYFLSFEDVEIGGLTPYNSSAKKVTHTEDKIIEGPISGVAGKVKKVADIASGIPGIGWIASGVSAVADVVGGVASVFGWSRPNEPLKLTYVHNQALTGDLAHSNTIDESIKLSLTTEASYPMSMEGMGGKLDGLSWQNVIYRWGLVNVETWAYASTAGTRIAYYPVTPDLCKAGVAPKNYNTPMSYIAAHFQAWTGSVRFRVTVAASPYIKGQLLCVYTPNTTTTPLTLDALMTASQYCVLNLNQELDKVMEVGWSSNMKYLVCGDPAYKDTNYPRANGYFHIYVLEPIVSSASVDLNVVVSVMPGDDFSFLMPTDLGVNDYVISGRVVNMPTEQDYIAEAKYLADAKAGRVDKPSPLKSDDYRDQSKPDRFPNLDAEQSQGNRVLSDYVASSKSVEQPYDLRDPNVVPTSVCYFGNKCDKEAVLAFTNNDAPMSARVWLKRYYKTFAWTNVKAITVGASANTGMLYDLQFPHVPQAQLAIASYQNNSVGGIANPTYKAFSPLSAILSCFVGYTGSTRHKVVTLCPWNGGSTNVYRPVELSVSASQAVQVGFDETYDHTGSSVAVTPGYQAYGVGGATAGVWVDVIGNKITNVGNAAAYCVSTTGPNVVAVELPFVSPYRYGNQTISTYGEVNGLKLRISMRAPCPDVDGGPSVKNSVIVNDYLSIGEDFNVFFYICCPSTDPSTNSGAFSYGFLDFPNV